MKTIERLQQASRKAVKILKQANDQACKGAEYVNSTGEVQASITEAINRFSDMSMQIAHATEEQYMVAQMLNESMIYISLTGDQTVQGSLQTTSASKTLDQLCSQLQHRFGQFRV